VTGFHNDAHASGPSRSVLLLLGVNLAESCGSIGGVDGARLTPRANGRASHPFDQRSWARRSGKSRRPTWVFGCGSATSSSLAPPLFRAPARPGTFPERAPLEVEGYRFRARRARPRRGSFPLHRDRGGGPWPGLRGVRPARSRPPDAHAQRADGSRAPCSVEGLHWFHGRGLEAAPKVRPELPTEHRTQGRDLGYFPRSTDRCCPGRWDSPSRLRSRMGRGAAMTLPEAERFAEVARRFPSLSLRAGPVCPDGPGEAGAPSRAPLCGLVDAALVLPDVEPTDGEESDPRPSSACSELRFPLDFVLGGLRRTYRREEPVAGSLADDVPSTSTAYLYIWRGSPAIQERNGTRPCATRCGRGASSLWSHWGEHATSASSGALLLGDEARGNA